MPHPSPFDTPNDSPDETLVGQVGQVGYGEYQRAFSATMYMMWDPTLNLNGSGCTAATTAGTGPNGGPPFVSTPSSCSGSIPVPITLVKWEWAGCAVNTLNQVLSNAGWSIQAGCGNFTPSTSVGSNGAYPQWTYISQNSATKPWSCTTQTTEGNTAERMLDGRRMSF
jgi:hypothetical protein